MQVRERSRLAAALALNTPGSTTEHAVVVLPSYTVGESLLTHYAPRLVSFEHRYLLATTMLPRIPGCHLALVTCEQPDPAVIDYYARTSGDADAVHRRLTVFTVPDHSDRSITAKLLDRPDVLESIRHWVGDRPAFLEPWNVTRLEQEVAHTLGLPLNGADPELWPLGFKSAGRRLFRAAPVPAPAGVEDVVDLQGVRAGIAHVLQRRPRAAGVVVKLDNSGAGDGNRVVRLQRADGSSVSPCEVDDQLAALPGWFVDALQLGAVVEELLVGAEVRAPSIQLDLMPDGQVHVVATHEQVLGGREGQVYLGCRLPAEPAYAAQLARHGAAVGRQLARRGALGRANVDFMATRRDREAPWDLRALEINLRKTGTTPPYTAFRHLVPGRFDAAAGRYVTADGETRCYTSTDNLEHAVLRTMTAQQAITAVDDAGLAFDHEKREGVVLHMLSALPLGRTGLTAYAATPAAADVLFERASAALIGDPLRVGPDATMLEGTSRRHA